MIRTVRYSFGVLRENNGVNLNERRRRMSLGLSSGNKSMTVYSVSIPTIGTLVRLEKLFLTRWPDHCKYSNCTSWVWVSLMMSMGVEVSRVWGDGWGLHLRVWFDKIDYLFQFRKSLMEASILWHNCLPVVQANGSVQLKFYTKYESCKSKNYFL